MRYWQVSLRRLSRAANKFERDGLWHRAKSSILTWYRVPDKKWLQRVEFADKLEEAIFQPLIGNLPPLPDLGQTAGFREETRFRAEDDVIYQEILLGYGHEQGESLTPAHIKVRNEDGLLYALTVLESMDIPHILDAAEKLVSYKSVFLDKKLRRGP